MALLNPNPVLATPEIMWLVHHAVVDFGPLPEEDLLALVRPPATRAVDEDATRRSSAARVAVRHLRDLDMLIDEGEGRLAAATDARPETFAAFCTMLRTAVMGTAATEAPLDEARANDLLRALAWLLSEDPVGEPWTESRAAHQAVPAGSVPVFVNPTRFNAFRFWAVALGMSEPSVLPRGPGGPLVPNPTRAFRDHLAGTYQPGEQVAASRLLEGWRTAVPVSPGGVVGLALGFEAQSGEVDRATTYALECGQSRGWLTLERRADAADTVLLAPLAGGGPRAISTVVIREVVDV